MLVMLVLSLLLMYGLSCVKPNIRLMDMLFTIYINILILLLRVDYLFLITKLDGIWKEFDSLTKCIDCVCDVATQLNNHAKLMKLMQFLSCLGESFNQVKSHILIMEPLPKVKIAFSIVSREESNKKNKVLFLLFLIRVSLLLLLENLMIIKRLKV